MTRRIAFAIGPLAALLSATAALATIIINRGIIRAFELRTCITDITTQIPSADR